MKILIIDAGNTYLKASIFDEKQREMANDQIKTKELNHTFFLKLIKGSRIDHCFIGSVVPSYNKKISSILKNDFNIESTFLKNKCFSKVLNLKKFNLHEIGIDILAFAYYLQQTYKKAIGVCFGTVMFAVAVDGKKLNGVIITPYVEQGIKNLANKAELIGHKSKIKVNSSFTNFGKTTDDSLTSGVNNFYQGFCGNLVLNNRGFKVLCITGGNNEKIGLHPLLKKHCKEYRVKNAVLTGYKLFVFNNLIK
ncbi:MAG: type III pantothenate kinase [Clostridia bacterium]|nr:type III pantothenate kinase [Clostridia bacterium]